MLKNLYSYQALTDRNDVSLINNSKDRQCINLCISFFFSSIKERLIMLHRELRLAGPCGGSVIL